MPRTVLNIGSGPANPEKLHAAFRGDRWREVRLDIEPGVQPDLVGDMVDMRALIADASVDAVWSSHNLEHLNAHQVPLALAEFARILKPSGFALITCPDVEAVANFIVARGIDEPVYQSPAGPVRPLDMLFGHGASIVAGHAAMAHRTGFTMQSLARLVLENGFAEIRAAGSHFALWGLCLMPDCRIEAIAPWFDGTPEQALVEEAGEGAPDAAPGMR